MGSLCWFCPSMFLRRLRSSGVRFAAILLDFRSLILQRARTWVGLPATAMCSSNVPPYLGFCHETAKRAVLWPHVWQFRDGNISARRVSVANENVRFL